MESEAFWRTSPKKSGFIFGRKKSVGRGDVKERLIIINRNTIFAMMEAKRTSLNGTPPYLRNRSILIRNFLGHRVSILMKEIVLSPALSKRIKQASVQDVDLLAKDLDESKRHCLHRHSQRVWERLARSERETIRKKVVDQNARSTFPRTRSSFEEYECVRILEALLTAKK